MLVLWEAGPHVEGLFQVQEAKVACLCYCCGLGWRGGYPGAGKLILEQTQLCATIRSGQLKHIGTSRSLQLVALLNNSKCVLLLDSGASNNFIGLSTCVKFKLQLHKRKTALEVRLANGKILKSEHFVEQLVDFTHF